MAIGFFVPKGMYWKTGNEVTRGRGNEVTLKGRCPLRILARGMLPLDSASMGLRPHTPGIGFTGVRWKMLTFPVPNRDWVTGFQKVTGQKLSCPAVEAVDESSLPGFHGLADARAATAAGRRAQSAR